MKEKQILVIRKEPGKLAEVEPLFENTLEAFQAAVGGYIETVGTRGCEFASIRAPHFPTVLKLMSGGSSE